MVTPTAGMSFVSHANPEDNEFSRWLSLQLAKLGYPVWCDLTRLLGGEDFWSDIEVAIRDYTAKFLYVLSRHSNQKPGTLQELSVATSVARQRELKDFVIPLRVDDLPYQDINIQLNRLNAIDFSSSWAAGLRKLVEKLELDGVRKDPRFSPSSVADWWSGVDRPGQSVLHSPDEYSSNWFSIEALPEVAYLHSVPAFAERSDFRDLPFPFWEMGSVLLSFACADDVNRYLRNGVRVGDSFEINPFTFLDGLDGPIVVGEQESRRAMVGLLRKGWRASMLSVGMYEHRLSNRMTAFYLPDGAALNNRVGVSREGQRPSWRALVGHRSRGQGVDGDPLKRYWHFAVDVPVGLEPWLVYQLVPHILFSTDGRRILDDGNVQRYRRSQGRDWWNAEWRDRTLGLMSWLAGGDSHMLVPLGPGVSAKVNSQPVSFTSPVTYEAPLKR